MRTIELTQGEVAFVDDEDFEDVNQYEWSASKGKNTWYAIRNSSRNGGKLNFGGQNE
jgi:hypothetical protein